jgi:DNA polymerase-3 subunit beta
VLHDFVRDLGGEDVELQHGDGNCHVKCGGDSCELVVADSAEFPEVPRFEEKGAIAVQAGTFSALVTRTAFAAAKEQGRYAMHGVLVEVGDGTLKLVATDGRRLAVAQSPIDSAACQADPATIVPTKGMQLLCRVMTDPLELVHLQLGRNQIGARTKSADVFARLLDGEFPRYAAVIPNDAQHVVEADADQLERKIRLVANVTGEEARAVRLSLKGGHVELFGSSAGRGEAHAHLDVDYRGPAAEIAFNPDYVVDGLKNCESATVRLEFNEKTAPGKFRLGENYLYVVMPITLDS